MPSNVKLTECPIHGLEDWRRTPDGRRWRCYLCNRLKSAAYQKAHRLPKTKKVTVDTPDGPRKKIEMKLRCGHTNVYSLPIPIEWAYCRGCGDWREVP